MSQGCWTQQEQESGARASPACSTASAARVQLGKVCWKGIPAPQFLSRAHQERLNVSPQLQSQTHCSSSSLLSRCWVSPCPISSSLWAPRGHTFIFNSVCPANLNNIIDFLFSWTDQSWDEHSCLAQLRGSVCTLEIFIDSHLCFQLIPIDFTLSVQMNNFVIFATCTQVGLFSSYF